MTFLAAAVRLADATPTAMPEETGVTSGQFFFIFLLGLLGASYFLYRSMRKQLGRIQMPRNGR